MEGLIKVFRIVSSILKSVTLLAAAASVLAIVITGFYPGIIVLILLNLIPTASNFYAKKIIGKSHVLQRNYFLTITILNLLTILVVLWMTFVIVIDRVFPNI